MKIFCIGIGGIGLSGVAQILSSQGHEVSGSDSSTSEITTYLSEHGIRFFPSQVPANLDEDTDLVIYSEAIPENNPERLKAKDLGIKSINYAHALGMITEGQRLIAITGTHGKTTITGMITSILLQAKLDPSIIIGSRIDLLEGQNFRVGGGELFLAEACEYRDNFLTLTPSVMLINSLEPDHLDYFKTAENYYASYQKLAEKIPENGTVIIYLSELQHLNRSRLICKVVLMDNEEASESSFTLQVPGRHNQRNAYAASKVAELLGIDADTIVRGLQNFHGTWRRFEYKGEINGAKVYDDYGHHPTEIKATLQAAREWFPDIHLVLVFQPHQYSRTREFFDQFCTSFAQASEVWITDIYKARDSEEDIHSTSAEILAQSVQDIPASYVAFDQLARKIAQSADPSRVFLVMGAGNISQIFSDLRELKKY
jgi:UDP-N-acetylmuramate--alanine ligase